MLATRQPPWTATDLATAIGRDPTTVQKWVQGKSLPRPKHLAESIRVLGLTPEEAATLNESYRSSIVRRTIETRGDSDQAPQVTARIHIQHSNSGADEAEQSGRQDDTARRAIEESTERLRQLDTEEALRQAINAVRITTASGTEPEQALAHAKLGTAYRYLNRLVLVKENNSQALSLLGLGDLGIGSGEPHLIFAELTRRLGPVDGDPVRWQAYQEVAVNHAFSYFQHDQTLDNLVASAAWFAQARLAARQLGDDKAWAAATHELAKVGFERHTVLDLPTPSPEGATTPWRSRGRSLEDTEGLLEARALLADAIQVDRRHGALDLGHALRHLGRLELTLGNQVVANTYFFQAEEFYQGLDPRHQINFLLDKARWYAQRPTGRGEAAGFLARMEREAISIKTPQMLSYAYIQLAHIFASYGKSEFPRCESYLAAALLLWPFGSKHRNFRRAVVFYTLVGGTAERLPRLASSMHAPFDVVTAFFSERTGPSHIKKVQGIVSSILTRKN
jgi:hypothetical protein